MQFNNLCVEPKNHKCEDQTELWMVPLRFIIEAPYRQIKYDTMQEEKIISNKKEAEARGQMHAILAKMERLNC